MRTYRVVVSETSCVSRYYTVVYTFDAASKDDALRDYLDHDGDTTDTDYSDGDWQDSQVQSIEIDACICDHCGKALEAGGGEDEKDICEDCACGVDGCDELRGECPEHDKGIGPDFDPPEAGK